MIRILIADDHKLLSESLRIMFEKEKEFSVIGTSYDGEHAVAMCRECSPDIVLMDIKMPIINGIDATALIKEASPNIKIIIITSLEDGKYILEAFRKGAEAYILKETPPDELIALIKLVYSGYLIVNASARQLMVEELSSNKAKAFIEPPSNLKSEEIEIIQLISEGKSNSEIATSLNFAEGTVKNKVTRIIEVLGLENRAQLVIYALKNNII